jgi:hypothetical protein
MSIELTNLNEKKVLINTVNIKRIGSDVSGSMLFYTDGTTDLFKESYEEIRKMLLSELN